MLAFNFTISDLKIRSYLLFIYFSLSFCQYFISPQRPIYNLLKWEEINTNTILINKVGPIINSDLISTEINSFYYFDSKSNGIIKGEIFPAFSINNTDGTRLRLYGTAEIALSEKLTIQNEFEFVFLILILIFYFFYLET